MKAKRTWLDRTIGVVSPTLELKRLQARAAAEVVQRHLEKRSKQYEGATKGRRTSGWTPAGLSATASIATALPLLRERSRDLVRNNAWARRGIEVIESNVIGAGIFTRIKAPSQRRKKEVEKLWASWAGTTACDYDGQLNYHGIQSLVMRTLAESGECLIRLRRARSSDNLSVPVQLQVLEPDFLDSQVNLTNSKKVVQGIEFDDRGRRVAYHLFEEHPGNFGFNLSSKSLYKSNRIPADEVLHIYRIERAGQVRGVPWLSPTIIKLRDFDDYEDAQLLRQKIAACFTAFVHDVESSDTDTEADREALGDRVEPGMIEFLPPGKEVAFADPPGVDGYKDYQSAVLHSIASGLGITYEALTQDYSQVNFSSARMGWLEFNRNIDRWRWNLFIPQFCSNTFNWFLAAADFMGANSNGITAAWTAPRREMIDPTKEIPAKIKAVRAGFTSLSEVIRENGEDPLELFEEIAADNKKVDELKLIFDSDARKVTVTGKETKVLEANENGKEND